MNYPNYTIGLNKTLTISIILLLAIWGYVSFGGAL